MPEEVRFSAATRTRISSAVSVVHVRGVVTATNGVAQARTDEVRLCDDAGVALFPNAR